MDKQTETVVLVMSDTHYGKRTPSFNIGVAEKRINLIGERVIRIKNLLGEYDLPTLKIVMLGDMVDGACIYPTQAYHQDLVDPQQQASELAEIMATWIKKQRSLWGAVDIEFVPGNHGRAGRFYPESSNYDLVFYQYLKLKLGEPLDPPIVTDPFLKKFQIHKHSYLMHHGASIQAYQRIPWYGLETRAKDWLSGPLAPIDMVLVGHFHQCGIQPVNRLQLITNGTLVTDDEWSRQYLGREPVNKWWMFGVSEKRAITWSFMVETV